jgi:Zn-dependent oligopeptidase
VAQGVEGVEAVSAAPRLTARSFRANILEPGGTADAMALWMRFLEKRGLK